MFDGDGPRLIWTGETPPGVRWPVWPGRDRPWGLFAPAHRFDRNELRRAEAVLSAWGLKIFRPPGLFRRARQLAGTDAERLALLSELMDDQEIGGLWAVRGGFGCQRLLPALADRWAGWPAKPILGFSDLTALHLARLRAAGVVGWHGPNLAALGRIEAGPDARSRADLKAAFKAAPPPGAWNFAPRDILKPGRVKGQLWGGNLCLLVHMLDSPWLPDPAGAILLLEEVAEYGYRLDRLLVSLRQSRLWPVLGGVVFGRFTGCGPPGLLRELLKAAAEACPGPVLMNGPFGHGPLNRLFPLGALAELIAD